MQVLRFVLCCLQPRAPSLSDALQPVLTQLLNFSRADCSTALERLPVLGAGSARASRMQWALVCFCALLWCAFLFLVLEVAAHYALVIDVLKNVALVGIVRRWHAPILDAIARGLRVGDRVSEQHKWDALAGFSDDKAR